MKGISCPELSRVRPWKGLKDGKRKRDWDCACEIYFSYRILSPYCQYLNVLYREVNEVEINLGHFDFAIFISARYWWETYAVEQYAVPYRLPYTYTLFYCRLQGYRKPDIPNTQILLQHIKTFRAKLNSALFASFFLGLGLLFGLRCFTFLCFLFFLR